MADRLAVVTGAAGFLGGHLLEELHRHGYRVRALDMPEADFHGARALGAEVRPCDMLRDPLATHLEGADHLFHLAAVFDLGAPPTVLERINVEGTRRVLEAAAAAGIESAVHFSSASVYGNPRSSPAGEDRPHAPTDAYGRSKARSEAEAWRICRDRGLPLRVLRPALAYGPRSRYGHAMFIAVLSLLRLRGKRAILLRGGPRSHHVHAADIAQAARIVAESPASRGHAYNVTAPTPLTSGEMLEAVARALGMETGPRIPISPTLLRYGTRARVIQSLLNRRIRSHWSRAAARHHLAPALQPRLDREWLRYLTRDHLYTTRKLEALGFRPRHPDFAEGIRETVRWYEENRWIPPRGARGLGPRARQAKET